MPTVFDNWLRIKLITMGVVLFNGGSCCRPLQI